MARLNVDDMPIENVKAIIACMTDSELRNLLNDMQRMNWLGQSKKLVRAGWVNFGESFEVSFWDGTGHRMGGTNPRDVIDAAIKGGDQ